MWQKTVATPGATAHFVFKCHLLGDVYYRWTIRLAGLNAPELTSHDPDEKEAALKARDYLSSLILNKIVTVACDDFDKYGQLLGTIYCDGLSVNKMLLDGGYARSLRLGVPP